MSDKFNNPWGDDNNKDKKGEDFEELMRKGKDKIMQFLEQKKNRRSPSIGGGNDFNFFNKKIFTTLTLAILFIWFASGFYVLQPDEEGVVMRFGKFNRIALSGLNYKLPSPVETIDKLSVTSINKEEIGFRSSGKKITKVEERLENSIANESQMLTTDENIVDINFEVQWKISNPKDFLFSVRDIGQENTIKIVAESAMREIIGLNKISDVLASERNKIQHQAQTLIQSMLDNYKRGVEIITVQLLSVVPPQDVREAYRDVQNAKQDKERFINEAMSYRNDIVPRSRGEGEKYILEAEGYKKRVIADAEGEAARFNLIYEQYKNAQDVTRKRMYIETMEEVLKGMDKTIIDNKGASNVVPYLALPDMNKAQSNSIKGN